MPGGGEDVMEKNVGRRPVAPIDYGASPDDKP